jgi:hypothetical protein
VLHRCSWSGSHQTPMAIQLKLTSDFEVFFWLSK